MIEGLRRRFIRIAVSAAALVVMLLLGGVNLANYLSVRAQCRETLDMILENQGTIPNFSAQEDAPDKRADPPFDRETRYATRYFVLRYNGEGVLEQADLEHIAGVTEEDADAFLSLARAHGAGAGQTGDYTYLVAQTGEDRWMAIFLYSRGELRAVYGMLGVSAAAAVLCIALVYGVVCVCSRRAIEPLVQASQRQKQFVTDASHELKTPLTVIATSLKVLEMDVGEQKWIDKAQGQVERMRDLVNALLAAARLDEQGIKLPFARFSIRQAVRETTESFESYAKTEGHALRLALPKAEAAYYGCEYSVRQLTSILLENAIQYASPGAEIRLCLRPIRKGFCISTRNACENLDLLEEGKLFDRFYRADPARRSGGFGVGLSMVRSIAENHKGAAYAKKTEDGELEIGAELR